MPSPVEFRASAVLALARMLLSRLRPVAVNVAVAITVLVALDAVRGGVTASDALAWALGGSLMLPLGPILGVVREKSDGSLRFLATLPISGAEHAAARALATFGASVPSAVAIALLVTVEASALPASYALLSGVLGALLLTGAALALTAVQLQTPIGRGLSAAMLWFVGFVVGVQGLGAAWEYLDLPRVGVLLASRRAMALISLGAWMAAAALVAVGMQRIANYAPRYRGESAAP